MNATTIAMTGRVGRRHTATAHAIDAMAPRVTINGDSTFTQVSRSTASPPPLAGGAVALLKK